MLSWRGLRSGHALPPRLSGRGAERGSGGRGSNQCHGGNKGFFVISVFAEDLRLHYGDGESPSLGEEPCYHNKGLCMAEIMQGCFSWS